jgi:hypothetical protein
MDFFGVVAMLWLFSAAAAALVGRLRGRGGDAMTLGVLLGPVGLLLMLFWIGRNDGEPPTVVLAIHDAQRPPRAADEHPMEMGRAA